MISSDADGKACWTAVMAGGRGLQVGKRYVADRRCSCGVQAVAPKGTTAPEPSRQMRSGLGGAVGEVGLGGSVMCAKACLFDVLEKPG